MPECVVRMEMPHDGLCDLAFSFLDRTCCTIEGNLCNYCDDGVIPKWCPIICQLPEGHGRLVEEKSVRWAIDDIVLEIANRTGRVGMTKDETMEYINNLCTIVPADTAERSGE